MAKPIRNKLLLMGVGAALLAYIAALMMAPSEVDWKLSFSNKDKVPFGSSILFAELPLLFSNGEIATMHTPVYNYAQRDDVHNTSFIFINDVFSPDELDIQTMLEMVEKGSNVFVAAIHFGEQFEKQLGFSATEDVIASFSRMDSLTLNLSNPKLQSIDGYTYNRAFNNTFFLSTDTLITTDIGTGNVGATNYVRIEYGKGSFFINTNPLAFTNYNLLIDQNYEYAFKCLSYLPNTNVIWDEYYKQKKPVSDSSFRYVLSQKALRNAWYLLLFSMFIYMVFGSRRMQRIIPIISPPQNTSLTFLYTIGRLYFRKSDHSNIAKKKYTYFLEFLRSKYFIDTTNIGAEMYSEISEKLDVPDYLVKQLFDMAKWIHSVPNISENELEKFDARIEFFYRKSRAVEGKSRIV